MIIFPHVYHIECTIVNVWQMTLIDSCSMATAMKKIQNGLEASNVDSYKCVQWCMLFPEAIVDKRMLSGHYTSTDNSKAVGFRLLS